MSKENKSIVTIFDAPTHSIAGYEQINSGLDTIGASNPQGRLYHVACAKDDGYLVIDVWETEELFDLFSKTLKGVIHELGETPSEPQIYPIHNIIKG